MTEKNYEEVMALMTTAGKAEEFKAYVQEILDVQRDPERFYVHDGTKQYWGGADVGWAGSVFEVEKAAQAFGVPVQKCTMHAEIKTGDTVMVKRSHGVMLHFIIAAKKISNSQTACWSVATAYQGGVGKNGQESVQQRHYWQ